MTTAPTLTSRNIGETENALRAVLARILNDTGLDYRGWAALKTVADSDPAISEDALAAALAKGLKIEDVTVRAVIDALTPEHIVRTTDGSIRPTASGAALYRRLTESIHTVTRRIYAGLDEDELAVAYRILGTIKERANQILSNQPAGGDLAP